MIHLSYTLSSDWNSREDAINWERADETALRYDAFLGNQKFIIDDVDLSAPWGWIPILDFAAGLVSAVEATSNGARETVFEFTESEATLQFIGERDLVIVSASYCSKKGKVGKVELLASAREYAGRVYNDVVTRHPGLLRNESFAQWFPGQRPSRKAKQKGSGLDS